MTRDFHVRATGIFERACEMPLAERASYLQSECGSDSDLRSYVSDLLAADSNAPKTFMANPAVAAIAPLLNATGQPMAMALAGAQLGNYLVGKQIGAGGMGVVYEARDQRLNRQVALKVLAVTEGPSHDAAARFQREAQAASALNHPNILSVFDAGEESGICYIATELVAGKTLRELLAVGPLPIKQLLEVGAQAASALSAAHAAGIIHRDIKPENIMVRNDGFVKVLDFGLAKLGLGQAAAPSAESSPGLIPGTAHYLSPEQVLGEPATLGSDLFSLGVVLYELATGVRPFNGTTQMAVFDSILRETPRPPAQLRREIGPELNALIQRLLERELEFRFQTAADVQSSLRRLQRGSQSGLLPLGSRALPKVSRRAKEFVAAAAVLTLLGSLAWLARGRNAPSDLVLDRFELLTSSTGEERFPNLSPDGSQFIYAGADRKIYLQRTGGSTALCLTPERGSIDTQPALSPDGTKIAFRSERNGGGIFVMEPTGENVIRVSAKGYLPAWSPDGKLLAYSDLSFESPSARGEPNSRLHILNLATGEDRRLPTGDAVQPNWSPHASRLAYWGIATGGRRGVFTVSTSGGEPVQVTSDPGLNWNPVWSPDGRALYFLSDRGGLANLWRVAINEKTGRTNGRPEPMTLPAPSISSFFLAADGRAVLFSSAQQSVNLFSVEYDPVTMQIRGAPQPALSAPHHMRNFSLSPNGSQLTYDTVGSPSEDIWVMNRDGSGRRRLYAYQGNNRVPRWSPLGDDIAFFSGRSGRYEIWAIRPDGSGLRQVTETTGAQLQAPSWSHDGRFIYSAREDGIVYSVPAYRGLIRNPVPVLPPGSGAESIFVHESPNGETLILSAFDRLNSLTLFWHATNRVEKTVYQAVPTEWLPDSSGFLFGWGGKCQYYDIRKHTARTLFEIAPGRMICIGIAAGRIYFTRSVSDGDLWLGRMTAR